MASIVLATVGRAVGTYVGGPVGGNIGAAIGAQVGAGIDGGGGSSRRHYEGPRLEQLAVQSALYGRMIPIVYGNMRLAGNVIWARPIKELQTTTTTTQGGKGGSRKRATSTSVTYSYYATLAIAICEGEITRISRVWADAKQLDLSQGTYRIYRGSQTQLPDPLIESFEGVGRTPAYRGIAYVVIEDFPLEAFGNRIPNFTFEVVRQTPQRDTADAPVEQAVRSIMMIPGSGEFVYDTVAQFKQMGQDVAGNLLPTGYKVPLNQHTAEGKANVLVALDHAQQTFPNLEWVGVVVNWFGDSMDIASCTIAPRVEFKEAADISPNSWSAAGLTRATATRVGKDGSVARYGGTPDDASLQRLCDAIRARGLKVFLCPMLLMDIAGKPWRGRLTGSSTQVANFFTKTQGYRNFILHYASLLAGRVDAFAIGTEMRDLTAITSAAGIYPAVSQLVSLAADVRSILGSSVKLTYAADWSEYHHTDGGWYHLDPLWASPHIDVVGIDAYFPLTQGVQTGYDRAAIRAGWTSGEGWDFYYTDAARTTTAPLAPAYAWKNIGWWWNNTHTNPNGSTTAWVPGSKPIWFTEIGYASVDGCTNEPNVFIDASSTESAFPRQSRGRVDFMAQRVALAAAFEQWGASSMVQELFLWAWDARPYPHWPDLRSVWADGQNWSTGHWVQGKLGASHVAAVVEEMATRVGLAPEQIHTQALQMMLDGFIIHERTTARAVLSQLMLGYLFTLVEKEDGLHAALLEAGDTITLSSQQCVPLEQDDACIPFVLERSEDISLPVRLEVHYLNRLQRYEAQVQAASRSTQVSREAEVMRLGLVLSENHARTVAELQLTRRWAERCRVTLQLPMRYAALLPNDVLLLHDGVSQHRLRVEQVQIGRPGLVRVRATRLEQESWDGYVAPALGAGEEPILPPSATRCEVLDIPALPTDTATACTLRVAATGLANGWEGASLLRLSDAVEDAVIAEMDSPATIGACLNMLGDAAPQRIDRRNTLQVALLGNATLASVSEAAMLGGANVAVVGRELIQFAQAELIGEGVWKLSTLLRGRLGTEDACAGHAVGERFVLLNAAVTSLQTTPSQRGLSWALRAVTLGASLDVGTEFTHTVEAQSLLPYAPVHVQAWRQGDGSIRLHWLRRARIDGAWRASVDIPLMEEREEYEVRVYAGASLKRQWRVNSPLVIYSAAEQLTDFGSAPSSLQLEVAQISASVGPGKWAVQTVPVC